MDFITEEDTRRLIAQQDTATNLAEILGIVDHADVKEVSEEDKWLLPGVVCTTNTLVYGQSSVGKTMTMAALIASLVDGREFLGVTPLRHGLKPLVVCADANGELEYKERLDQLGITSGVKYFACNGEVPDSDTWMLLQEYARAEGVGLVVIDHATGTLDGNEIERLPWLKFWQESVAGFELPTVVVAHSSTSAYEGKQSHRPMGNSAATQFTRTEVEIFKGSNNKFDDSVRTLRSSSRYGGGIERRFRIVDPGVIVQDTEPEPEQKKQARDADTMDNNLRIARLAAGSRATTAKAVAEDIAGSAGASARTLSARKLPELVKNKLLVKNQNKANGLYSLGPKVKN
ncbi:AAA family ATPase [Corynebacterium sp. HMSC078H07]|uniref:AAA family ATPase n=1 Tax=Corynebacterium sp. HMSC078H07 TaxID=1739379 RepID=UPI0008A4980A|nr:AAA family ATPase [Corynebacterium sp. HMSC078H07]OFR68224.1 hypothetical protein HMPREF2875_06415 [Corynebacterium sp. HMSC078H07]